MPEAKLAPHFEVMTDVWGWGEPHQFVRGDVVTEEDVKPYDIKWAETMGTVRRMKAGEVRALEALGPGARSAAGLLSTTRPVGESEEDAQDIQDEARADSGVDDASEGLTDDKPKSPGVGGGTAVDQGKLEADKDKPK